MYCNLQVYRVDGFTLFDMKYSTHHFALAKALIFTKTPYNLLVIIFAVLTHFIRDHTITKATKYLNFKKIKGLKNHNF